jgi:hypothetical protein
MFRLWRRGQGMQKTHSRCQPWVFVKSLRSTSANGIAGYDDYQNDSLDDVFQHCGIILIKLPARSSLKMRGAASPRCIKI